jgi:hypothetical protein
MSRHRKHREVGFTQIGDCNLRSRIFCNCRWRLWVHMSASSSKHGEFIHPGYLNRCITQRIDLIHTASFGKLP